MSNSNAPDSEIERKLSPGEKLLWSGQPRQGFQLRSSDLRAIPFSLLFCGFAIFWEFGAFSGNAPLLFKCVGSVFVLIGLYFVVGGFFVDSMMRKRTFYGFFYGESNRYHCRICQVSLCRSAATGVARLSLGRKIRSRRAFPPVGPV